MKLVTQDTDIITVGSGNTFKVRHRLNDGSYIESCVVNLPYRDPSRVVCVSSQVGCPYDCIFCASGRAPYKRNLETSEILSQVEFALDSRLVSKHESFDVTYMGIGEPLANIQALQESSLAMLSRPWALRKINISTTDPGGTIKSLSRWAIPGRYHVQLSLNSPCDTERRRLMHCALRPIDQCLGNLKSFGAHCNDVPCLNYILFRGVNDTLDHARALARWAHSGTFYVKISQYCPIRGTSLGPSPETRKRAFIEVLREEEVCVKMFISQGQDIQAGCGQLVAEME